MGSSRFHLVDKPAVLPGVCFICKTANDGPYVDTGVTVPFDGAVYIGRNCLKEMFSLIEPGLDGVTVRQLESLKRRVNEQVNTQLTRAFASIGDTVNDARTRIRLGVDQFIPDVPLFDAFDVEEPDQPSEGESGNSDAPVESDGSDSGEGADGVSGNSDDGPVGAGDGNQGEFRL